MKNQNSPRGKFYFLQHKDLWGTDAKEHCHISNIILSHMVLVIGRTDIGPGWVTVVTVRVHHPNIRCSTILTGHYQVTKTVNEHIDNDFYIPIRPTPKNRKTNMQLKLCDDPWGDTGFSWRSLLRVDAVHEVPREILVEQRSYGRQLELQEQSYNRLLHFMRQISVIH